MGYSDLVFLKSCIILIEKNFITLQKKLDILKVDQGLCYVNDSYFLLIDMSFCSLGCHQVLLNVKECSFVFLREFSV